MFDVLRLIPRAKFLSDRSPILVHACRSASDLESLKAILSLKELRHEEDTAKRAAVRG